MKKKYDLIIGIGGNINSKEGLHPIEVGKKAIKKLKSLSIHIQKQNTDAHRIKSRPISGTDTLAQILKQQNVPLYVIWGEKDASVGVYLEDRMAILRSINSEVHFHVQFKLGHWLMYEDETMFNELFQKIIQV